MNARSTRMTLLYTEFRGQLVPTVRDASGALLEPACTYLDAIAQSIQSSRKKTQTARREVRSRTYSIFSYVRFLAGLGQEFEDSTDALLQDFRAEAFAATRDNPRSRGHDYQAEDTTNIKLQHIYDALDSCQHEGWLPAGTIGWQKCKVRSTLPECRKIKNAFNTKYENRYPELFDNTGALTEVDEGQYWMTDEDVRLIDLMFRETENPHKRERDTLMFHVGEATGWRRGSLNSLLETQFSPTELKSQAPYDTFGVRPISQKGRRRYRYELPWELVNEIARYIREDRKVLMEHLGIGEDVAEHRIFLSVTTGKPLVERTVTDIFSAALRSLGRPKGASSHSMKRRKGQATMEQEIDVRRRTGEPLDRQELEYAVMRKLGQATREAQRSYVRVSKLERAQTVEENLQNKVLELETRCAALSRLAEQRGEEIRKLLTERKPIR